MQAKIEKIEQGKQWATFFQVEGESILVRLREATTRVEQPPSASEQRRRQQNPDAYWLQPYEFKPTGVLIFALLQGDSEGKKWSDQGGN
jgi:hypothetical protein